MKEISPAIKKAKQGYWVAPTKKEYILARPCSEYEHRTLGTLDAPLDMPYTKAQMVKVAKLLKGLAGFDNVKPVMFRSHWASNWTVAWGTSSLIKAKELDTEKQGHAALGKAFGISDKEIRHYLQLLLLRRLEGYSVYLTKSDEQFLDDTNYLGLTVKSLKDRGKIIFALARINNWLR